jgi:hypothetical protein
LIKGKTTIDSRGAVIAGELEVIDDPAVGEPAMPAGRHA